MKTLLKLFIFLFINFFIFCSTYQEQQIKQDPIKNETNISVKKIEEIKTQTTINNQEINKNQTQNPTNNQEMDKNNIEISTNNQEKEKNKETSIISTETDNSKTFDPEPLILADKKIFETIKENIEEFKTSSEDTLALKEKKQKLFAQKIDEINKKYKGKLLQFQYLFLEDVIPEKELTPYGRQKLKKMEKEQNVIVMLAMALEVFLGCDECFRNTGRYEVELYLPKSTKENLYEEKDYRNKIIFITSDKIKAFEYKKGQYYPISGKVKSIKIEDSYLGVKTTIYLE